MRGQTEALPQVSPYEISVSSELQQYQRASDSLVQLHDTLRARTLSEQRNNRVFEGDATAAWDAYCEYTTQLPHHAVELMAAARFRLGDLLEGRDAEMWFHAHDFVQAQGYVPDTIDQASSPLLRQAIHAALDEAVFRKAYEWSCAAGRPVPSSRAGMSSYAANTLVSLATDPMLPDRLVYEAERVNVGNIVRSVVGSQLSERTKGVGRAVLYAQTVGVAAHPSPDYYAYLQGAADQLRPYARAIAVLRSVQGWLQPNLQDGIGNEPLSEVQLTIDLVEALRHRAGDRHEVLTDGMIYEWMCMATKREGESSLGNRLEQSCQILYALLNGDVSGRLPF